VSGENFGGGLDATMRDFAPGQKLFRRYTLKRTLGRGGMGIVWLARDEELERDVALKFLPDLIIHDRAVLGDLKRETRRSLELTHKNIVRIHDFVHDETSGCISMEYVDGDTLGNLRADKPHKVFEPDELREWISQLCDALDYAHNHVRIVHRDLKPSNVMVNQRGELKVADFGIARSLSDSMSMLTMDRGKSGTLLYMSPQQLDGDRGSHLDDIYSLGAAIYELLTSKPPFYSGNVDRQIREKIPPPMSARRQELEIAAPPVEETWEDVVRQCLAKDPAKRPQSVSGVAKMLAVPSPKTRRATRDGVKTPPANRLLLAAASGAAVLVIALSVWFIWRTLESPARTSRALAPPPSVPSPLPTVLNTAAVVLNTSPAGAAVTLSGKDIGQTPVAVQHLAPGHYTMRIALAGYEPAEKQIDLKRNESLDLGTIALSPGKAIVDLASTPAGAKVFHNGVVVGTTPLRRDDLGSGDATFLFVHDGCLPAQIKGSLVSQQTFKRGVSLAPIPAAYTGEIRVQGDNRASPRPVSITIDPDLASGTMTQETKSGEFAVRYNGAWEGPEMHAITGDVLSQPTAVRWRPESFVLRFSEDGNTGTYECIADGKTYTARLSAANSTLSELKKIASTYRGILKGSELPLSFNFGFDRKSGTMTQTTKSGELVVNFTGIWQDTTLRAVTGDVVSKPGNVQWQPESFTLRFDRSGKHGTYESVSDGKTYSADISPP
jgi:serine/threonine protein kinase